MSLYSDLNYIKPFIRDENGNLYLKNSMLYDIESVYQSIFSLLGTKKGERVFRPGFGLNMVNYLFEPCDSITAQSILYDITHVMDLEPRVNLDTSKTVVQPVPEQHLFIINLYFNIIGLSNNEKSLSLIFRQKGNSNG